MNKKKLTFVGLNTIRTMKKAFIIAAMLLAGSCLFAQNPRLAEKKAVQCDPRSLYALQPTVQGQIPAECPLNNEQMAKKLNTDIPFLRSHTTLTDKCRMGWIINCKGQVVNCAIDAKSTSTELDKQLESALKNIGDWKPGTLNGNPVDCAILRMIVITDGVITVE